MVSILTILDFIKKQGAKIDHYCVYFYCDQLTRIIHHKRRFFDETLRLIL